MDDSGQYCDSKALAQLWGVTARRVQQLSQDGVIGTETVNNQKKYNWVTCTQKYIKHLSDAALGRQKKEEDKKGESAKLEAEVRYKTAKAEMTELELQELNGQLHRSEDVEAIMTDNVLLIRSMILALPSRLAVDVVNAKTATEASDIIKRECYRMLETMAAYEYDPEAYQARVRERKGWTEKQADEDGGREEQS